MPNMLGGASQHTFCLMYIKLRMHVVQPLHLKACLHIVLLAFGMLEAYTHHGLQSKPPKRDAARKRTEFRAIAKGFPGG